MIKPKKLSRDSNKRANEIGRLLTGEPPLEVKDASAVERGRLGGLKGGKARAAKLSPADRRDSAKKAARARWAGKGEEKS